MKTARAMAKAMAILACVVLISSSVFATPSDRVQGNNNGNGAASRDGATWGDGAVISTDGATWGDSAITGKGRGTGAVMPRNNPSADRGVFGGLLHLARQYGLYLLDGAVWGDFKSSPPPR